MNFGIKIKKSYFEIRTKNKNMKIRHVKNKNEK